MSDRWGLLTTEERDRLAAGEHPIEGDGFEELVQDRIETIEGDAALLAEYDEDLFSRLEGAIQPVEAKRSDDTPPTLGELDFPHDDEKCKGAAYAAREFIRASGGATRVEIISNVMPMYPLTYHVDAVMRTLDADEEVEVPWWHDVVRPALEVMPTVEAPAEAGGQWIARGRQ